MALGESGVTTVQQDPSSSTTSTVTTGKIITILCNENFEVKHVDSFVKHNLCNSAIVTFQEVEIMFLKSQLLITQIPLQHSEVKQKATQHHM